MLSGADEDTDLGWYAAYAFVYSVTQSKMSSGLLSPKQQLTKWLFQVSTMIRFIQLMQKGIESML